jgi:hypothetical protein
MEVSGQPHAQATLPPGKHSFIHCIGGWVGCGVGLDVLERRGILPVPRIYDSSCIRVIICTPLDAYVYLYAVVYSVIRHPFLSKCGRIDDV